MVIHASSSSASKTPSPWIMNSAVPGTKTSISFIRLRTVTAQGRRLRPSALTTRSPVIFLPSVWPFQISSVST